MSALAAASDWVEHHGGRPPPVLGPGFEVEAVVSAPRPGLGFSYETRTGRVHELPWDRVIAWRLL